ncbi:MAG: beta strand repeat-containing protein, partial [Candidatus Heimdallarchaeota archaeon]
MANDISTFALTLEDVQQGFADNFPLKSTVIVFDDTDNPWDSNRIAEMNYRTIAVNKTSELKWILYIEGGLASDETSWSSFTSSLDDLNGGSGIILENDGSIDLGGALTKDTVLFGTNGVSSFEITNIPEVGINSGVNNPALALYNDHIVLGDSATLNRTNNTLSVVGDGGGFETGDDGVVIDGTAMWERNVDITDSIKLKAGVDVSHLETSVANGSLTIDSTDLQLNMVQGANVANLKIANGIGTFSSVTTAIRGMFYDDNYAGDWGTSGLNPRVIVDKGFVEDYVNTNATIDAQNGLTISTNATGPDQLDLGGNLTKDTDLDGGTQFDFTITDTDIITFSSQNATTFTANNTADTTTVTIGAGFGVTTAGTISIATTGATAALSTATGGISFDDGGANTVTAGDDKGLVYAAATYRTNFTELSLVDKGYVDSIATGLSIKTPVVVVADVNVTASGIQTIDGVLLSVGDRVLLTAQTDSIDNGIYDVAVTTWARSTDADETGEIVGGSYVFVDQGTTNADTGWVQTENGDIEPGVDIQTWVLFNRAGFVNGAAGIKIDTNDISIDLADVSGLKFSDDTAAGKLLIELEGSTKSGMQIDAVGLSLQLNDYNAQADVKIQTSDNDLLFIDTTTTVASTTSIIGITSPTSTNLPNVQNAIIIANEIDITLPTEITSYLGIERDTGQIFLRRDDESNNTLKGLDIITGSVSLSIKDTNNADAVISKIEATTVGGINLTATDTFNLAFNGAATLTDNRTTDTTRQGLTYSGDYNVGFDANDRSLPDVGWIKTYVTNNATIDAGSGLTKTVLDGTDEIKLGGTVTEDTNLNSDGAGTRTFGIGLTTSFAQIDLNATTVNIAGGTGGIDLTSTLGTIALKTTGANAITLTSGAATTITSALDS